MLIRMRAASPDPSHRSAEARAIRIAPAKGRAGQACRVAAEFATAAASRWLFGLAWLLLTGCSGFGVLNALTPDRAHERVADIAYGDHPRKRLDLYRSEREPSRGTLVFVYGGGWEEGDKDNYRFVAQSFTRHGYDVVIPDYRVYPEVRFPVFVEDVAASLDWLAREGRRYGLDDKQVWLAGHSAGAHIAAMLTYDERYLQATAFDPTEINGFIGISGAYDFLPLSSERLKRIFYPPALRPSSQPVNFVDGSEPAALLFHGTDDETAWPRNTRRLGARIAERNGRVRTVFFDGMGHVRTAIALSSTFRFVAPVVGEMLAFMEETGEEAP